MIPGKRMSVLALPALLLFAVSGLKEPIPPVFARAHQPSNTNGRQEVMSQPEVERLSPEADAILPKHPQIQKVVSGFTWNEGPIWTPAGDLLFADIPGNSIQRLGPDDHVSVFIHPSGYQGSTPYGGPEPGSNGMTLDSRGRLTVAGHAQRDVWRLETMDPKGQITILADSYQGKRLNSPNDLVYRSDGSLYFTDPPYGLPTQGDSDPAKELAFNGVYRIPNAQNQPAGTAPDREHLQLLLKDLPRPNGIVFSPDEKYLYVDNSGPRKFWMRYRVEPDGSLTDGILFYDATSDPRPGTADGMKVDEAGNLYSAAPGGVWIFAPSGKRIAALDIPEPVGNLAWGGVNGRILYIAASGCIYRVSLKVHGVRPRIQ